MWTPTTVILIWKTKNPGTKIKKRQKFKAKDTR